MHTTNKRCENVHIKNSLYNRGKRADFSIVTVFYSNKLYKTLRYNLKKRKIKQDK